MRALSKLCRTVDGELRIVGDPPLVTPIEDVLPGAERDHLEDVVRRMIRTYRRTLPRDRRQLLESYRYVHAARKVVGVGSVGARAWILLMVGRDDDDPLFLQFKEAQASVLEPFLGRSQYAQHGQRVVEGQRMMQAAPDILLGWERIVTIDGEKKDFYIRQLWDAKGSAEVELMDPSALDGLRPDLRLDARARPRPLGRPDRDRRLSRHRRLLRPRHGRLRRDLRGPERTRLRALKEAVASGRVAAQPGVSTPAFLGARAPAHGDRPHRDANIEAVSSRFNSNSVSPRSPSIRDAAANRALVQGQDQSTDSASTWSAATTSPPPPAAGPSSVMQCVFAPDLCDGASAAAWTGVLSKNKSPLPVDGKQKSNEPLTSPRVGCGRFRHTSSASGAIRRSPERRPSASSWPRSMARRIVVPIGSPCAAAARQQATPRCVRGHGRHVRWTQLSLARWRIRDEQSGLPYPRVAAKWRYLFCRLNAVPRERLDRARASSHDLRFPVPLTRHFGQ